MKWGCFTLDDVFDIKPTANGIDKVKLTPGAGEYPYVTRSDMNNGVNMFVSKQERYNLNSGNCISIGLDTQTVFYQPADFYTGQNIQILRHERLNEYTGKFLLPLLERTLSIYSWGGNGATLTRLRRSKIFLPADDSGRPDWNFMEDCMRKCEPAMIRLYISRLKVYEQDTEILTLDGVRWGTFYIRDIFTISPGKRLRKEDMTPGNIPFVGASDSNNGVTAFISNSNISEDNNVLGVNYNGSVVENFYHPYTALFSDDVKRFHIKGHEGNKYIYLFIKSVICQQKEKYNYGYKFNDARMQVQQIQLPVDDSGNPDWAFMERYMRQEEQRLTGEYTDSIQSKLRTPPPPKLLSLKCMEWRTFYLRDIFTYIQRGRRLKNDDHIPGNIPYVSSSAMNNGVDDFVGNTEGVRIFRDCITIANSGSVGTAFYHSYEFVASDHVTALKSAAMNRYICMFIVTALKSLREKYSFNREINESRINREQIILPADSSGNPDWQFMTQYMIHTEQILLARYLSHIADS